MFFTRATIYRADCRSLEEGQQALQTYIDMLLNTGGRSRGIYCILHGPHKVLSLYSQYTQSATHRRITGGPVFTSQSGLSYLGVATVYPGLLKSMLEDVRKSVERIGGVLEGGYIRHKEGNGILGITKLGTVGVIEIITRPGDLPLLIVENLFKSTLFREAEIPDNVKLKAPSYRAETWLKYGLRDARIKATASRGDFYITLKSNIQDGFLTDVTVDGNLYAAPPMEPYNLAARLEGTQINELMFYQIKLAWRERAELAGIDYEDIDKAMDALYEEAEKLA